MTPRSSVVKSATPAGVSEGAGVVGVVGVAGVVGAVGVVGVTGVSGIAGVAGASASGVTVVTGVGVVAVATGESPPHPASESAITHRRHVMPALARMLHKQ